MTTDTMVTTAMTDTTDTTAATATMVMITPEMAVVGTMIITTNANSTHAPCIPKFADLIQATARDAE